MMQRVLLSLLALLVCAAAQAEGDASAGRSKAAVCSACHGADGNSANPQWPKLAGQGAAYIEKQLADFKGGARKDPIMTTQAASLNTKDMADLAAHFSGQETSPGGTEKDKLTLGERIYRGGNNATGVAACMGCHGPTGSGNPPAKFPRLAGQHAAYVGKAMKDFRNGTRSNDPNGIMRTVAKHMSDAEIEAVASYVSGLH